MRVLIALVVAALLPLGSEAKPFLSSAVAQSREWVELRPSEQRASAMIDINRFLTSFSIIPTSKGALAAQPAQATAPAPAQRPEVRSWTEVRSLDSGFLVEFPAAPRQSDQAVKLADGTTAPSRTWMVEMDRGWTAYIVGHSEISTARRQSATTDTILSDAVQGALNNVPGSALVSATPIEFQGYPGRDVLLTANDGTGELRFRARIVLVGLRVYQQVAVTSERSNLELGELDRYFKSFLLLAR
jgi:hypothetical protein